MMDENHSDTLPEPREHLDFPTLLIDQDADLSPSPVSVTTTSSDPLTPTPSLCTMSCSGHEDSERSRDNEGNQEGEKRSNKCPSRPTRMVTRSQTAAIRRCPYSQPCHNLQQDEVHLQRDFQDDSEAQSSSCASFDLSDEDDPIDIGGMASGKVSPRSGVDLGTVCPRCGVVLMTVSGRIAHNAAHSQHGAHCLYCQQVFITGHGRDAHQRLHGDSRTLDVDDYCECVLCGGAFISVANLELHLLELHGRPALLNPDMFRMGISSGGEGDGGGEGGWALYYCGVCGQKFTYSFNLDCHMVLHSRPVYCCTVCDSSFSSYDPLMSHVRSHRQPTIFTPVIHVPTSAPPSTTSFHTSTLPSTPNFPIPVPKRRASQSLASHHPSTVWNIQKSQIVSPVSSCDLTGSSGSVGGVQGSQAVLKYFTPQTMEKNIMPWTTLPANVPHSQCGAQQCERQTTVVRGKE